MGILSFQHVTLIVENVPSSRSSSICISILVAYWCNKNMLCYSGAIVKVWRMLDFTVLQLHIFFFNIVKLSFYIVME